MRRPLRHHEEPGLLAAVSHALGVRELRTIPRCDPFQAAREQWDDATTSWPSNRRRGGLWAQLTHE